MNSSLTFQALQILVPKVENEGIHCFIKEIMTIVRAKGWTGNHYSTRNAHVDRTWQMIICSRWTSQTLVVRSLLTAGKLWESINLVYVWELMENHSNPLAIYNWALQLVLQHQQH